MLDDIRLVCTHDALKLAETLMRLLDAEEHRTRLSYGRQSLQDLELSKSDGETVLLIWSHEAQTSHYMLEWANAIAPERLIEIASAHGAPRFNGHAPVIDFVQWRGERGGRSWNALAERLRTIVRANAPPKPVPTRAVLAVGMASLAAVAGAFAVRVNDHLTPDAQFAHNDDSALIDTPDPALGIGGAIVGVEPASIDEQVSFRAGPRAQMMTPLGDVQIVAIQPYEPVQLNDPTLMERISALNPLRRDDDGEAN